jgi:hypothetical protein
VSSNQAEEARGLAPAGLALCSMRADLAGPRPSGGSRALSVPALTGSGSDSSFDSVLGSGSDTDDNMALAFFTGYKALFKTETTAIDNEVFRMHYRTTVAMLVVFSGLLTATQFFGNPITCHMRGEDGIKDLVTTYCWVHGTYTLRPRGHHADRQLSDGERVYADSMGYSPQHINGAAHYGFGTYNKHRHEKVYHSYYQWVCLVFFLQVHRHIAPIASSVL